MNNVQQDDNTNEIVFVAGWNMPGYMPDGEPATFDDFESARGYIVHELKDRLEASYTGIDTEDLSQFRTELEEGIDYAEKQPGEFSFQVQGYVYWVKADA